MEFGNRVRLKPSNDRGEFEVEEIFLLSFSKPFGGVLFATRRYDIVSKFEVDRAKRKKISPKIRLHRDMRRTICR